MVRLVAKTPLAGQQLPQDRGGIALREVLPGRASVIAPYRGREADVGAALDEIGLAWPAPGQAMLGEAGRILWSGRSMALLTGAAPPEQLEQIAALTDQTGASAVVEVAGPRHEEMLARLIPVDLRPGALPEGATRRTLIGHMPGSVTRWRNGAVELAVMRSMGATLMHDLRRAIDTWSARP